MKVTFLFMRHNGEMHILIILKTKKNKSKIIFLKLFIHKQEMTLYDLWGPRAFITNNKHT